MIQIKDILKSFTVSHTTVYNHIDKLWIEKIKKEDNTVYIQDEDYERLKKSIGGKNIVKLVREEESIIIPDNDSSKELEEYDEEVEQLNKRNKVLETQVKQYWEAMMTYKWENKELREKVKEVEEKREKERSEYAEKEKEYISTIGEKDKEYISTVKDKESIVKQYKIIMFFLWVIFVILILWLVFYFSSL